MVIAISKISYRNGKNVIEEIQKGKEGSKLRNSKRECERETDLKWICVDIGEDNQKRNGIIRFI